MPLPTITSIEIASATQAGVIGANGAQTYAEGQQRISADGRFVVFDSFSEELSGGSGVSSGNVLLKDMQTGEISVVSDGLGIIALIPGAIEYSFARNGTISGDGRYVAFQVQTTYSVNGFAVGSVHIVVRDMTTGAMTQVSDGQFALVDNPSISSDGSHVVYSAVNSTTGETSVLLGDRFGGAPQLVSDEAALGSGGDNFHPTVSGDGRIVTFSSNAADLPGADGSVKLYIKDVTTGDVTLIADGGLYAALSFDGRYAVYQTPGFSGDIRLHDRVAGTTIDIGDGTIPTVSDNGQFVAWIGPDSFSVSVLNRSTGQIFSETVSSNSLSALSVNDDGRHLTFVTAASDLAPGDTNGSQDVFTLTLSVWATNVDPVITSNGGGETASISVNENTTDVAILAAIDADVPAQALTYSIVGGADAGHFAVNATTGRLSFSVTPNFEAPADAGGDNVYDVVVQASDGNGGIDTQSIAVTVGDADEAGPRLLSIVADDALVTWVGEVHYTVTFSEGVTGVDTNQFSLTATGVIGAAITAVTAVAGTGGTQYNVAVSAGTGNGDLTLVFDGESVRDLAGNPLPGGDFAPSAVYAVGVGPGSIATADVNSDGHVDLLTSNFNSNSITILLNNGEGAFPTRTDLGAGSIPVSVTAADVSGDGIADLIYVNRDEGSLTVRFGNGDATFQGSVTYAVGLGTNSNGITVADVNRDGASDILVANHGGGGPGTVSVLLNTGSGTFLPRMDFATSDGPYDLVHADLNGDGALDIIAANQGSDSVSVLIGNGDGTFQARTDYSTGSGSGPTGLDAGDLDGDGTTDLVVAAHGSNSIAVMVGNGDGTFQTATEYATGLRPLRIELTDVDGDGDRDAFVVEYGSNSASVLLNDGTGGFGTRNVFQTNSSGPYEVASSDLNGDGRADLVVANADGNALSVFLNQVTPVSGPTYTIEPNVVTVEASTAEGTEGGELVFTFRRTGDLSESQLVDYGYFGSATNGIDFTNAHGVVEFATGSSTAELRLTTFADGLTEGLEDVGVYLAQNYRYQIGSPGTALAQLLDANFAPTITSNGGEDSASISLSENTIAVTTVAASDADLPAQPLTYSIAGGADAALFTIDSTSGALSFVSAPDFETPTDAGGDNVYDVTVQVSDGNGGIDTQMIAVTVTNVGGVTIIGTNAANTVDATTTVPGQPLPTIEEDAILGNGGADILNGLGGNDTITGGAGNDTVNAGGGDDTLIYAIGHGADIVDGGDGLDVLAISGTAGNDTLDVLFNGSSLNNFEGGTLVSVERVSADLLGGINTLTYAGAGTTAGVVVDLAAGLASGFTSLANVANVTGGNFADLLSGDAGANVLNGGNGDDTIAGGLGPDTLAGGGGIDTLSYAGESDAFFVNLALGTARRGSVGAAVEDTISGFENIIGGSGSDELVGNTSANTIDGGSGNDIITGGGGNDILSGGLGDDTFAYTIGQGADTVDGGGDFDTVAVSGTTANNTLSVIYDGTILTSLAGGSLIGIEAVTAALDAGTDTLSYTGTTAALNVDLAAGAASGFATISGVENVIAGSGNDTLIGAAGTNNALTGGAGDDTFIVHDTGDTVIEAAGGGTDEVRSLANTFTISDADVENLIFIGTGNFVGTGNGSANVIIGGGGNDTLSGAGGDDRIEGGAGSDAMNGGAGADTFVFRPGFGNDMISGFDANPTGGQDLIELVGFGIAADNFASRVVIEDAGADTLITVDNDPAQSIRLMGVANAVTVTVDDFRFL